MSFLVLAWQAVVFLSIVFIGNISGFALFLITLFWVVFTLIKVWFLSPLMFIQFATIYLSYNFVAG